MKIAILMAQTDVSRFAQQFPDDGEKFITLLRQERPDWDYSNYLVFQGDFPEYIQQYDGFLFTGSLASANDSTPWALKLQELVRAIEHAKIPQFGACYGHQLIAKALGGTVIDNPGGWCFGVADSVITSSQKWMIPAHPCLTLYAAHSEQVNVLPSGAAPFAHAISTPNAGFTIGHHVATTQYHPEMTQQFFHLLIDKLETELPAAAIATAQAQKNHSVQGDLMAKWIVQFFEQGQG